MSSLPNEIFFDMTKFLPNDEITDLMLLSRTFNALVTPRLQKIDQEMETRNQSIKSFMPSPAPEHDDCEWISQLNLKRFLPIGSAAKNRMKKVLKNERQFIHLLRNATLNNGLSDEHKKEMSLERFDNRSFLRILSALVSVPKFREEYNISYESGRIIILHASFNGSEWDSESYDELRKIWNFFNPS